ncbi:hypothetical protein [Ruegeria arenilitoris]|uniref:hypothetical protein n=1 Tax=Ruegeria arenilitoris TaxID=1173585 RepID=UPI00147B4164|nr:hypothetical protein [Ruegeria arenilitoris]
MYHPLSYISVICLGGLMLFGTVAQAQTGHRGPDLGKIASEIGVPQSALQSCLGDRPKPGKRPERPDAGLIASCLSKAGHPSTAQAIEKALAAAAPTPRR